MVGSIQNSRKVPSGGSQSDGSSRRSQAEALDRLEREWGVVPSPHLLLARCIVLKPDAALFTLSEFLLPYEQKEILDFKKVYYVGQNFLEKMSKVRGDPRQPNFDDEEGCYIMHAGDHIAYRYEIVNHLGKGSFGSVVKAKDHCTGGFVAVKVIRNGKRYQQQAEREIDILRKLNQADPQGRQAIIRMLDNFVFRSHTCITYEVLSQNLYDNLQNTDYHPSSLGELKRIAATLLVSISFLHKNGIIHCDLKPENILLVAPNTVTAVKLIDLGTACYINSKPHMYVQSRFYRAPEVILGSGYDERIDLWSFGCVLCELATGFPLFPGESEREQLLCIMEVLGEPPREIVEASPKRDIFFDPANNYAPRLFKNSTGRTRRPGTKSLARFMALPETHALVDFVQRFLVWDPSRRILPEEALRHRWLADCPDEKTTPIGDGGSSKVLSRRGK